VFEFSLSNPSAVDTTYTLIFTNGTAGSADYYHCKCNCTAGSSHGTVSVPTTADFIAESSETFTIVSGTASATEQSIMMRLQSLMHLLLGYRRKSAVLNSA
jgi:hypothetical protein